MASVQQKAVEYSVFGAFMAASLGTGLYFALRRCWARKRLGGATDGRAGGGSSQADEEFLGGRSIGTLPLALSVLASMVTATGLVGFTAHFYAHGMHLLWGSVPVLVMLPFIAYVVIPLVRRLGVTSVFQGGMRGVVWTDSVQGILILVCPLTILGTIVYDSVHASTSSRLPPFRGIDVRPYLLE
ncbi:hypothetical protein V5799_028371 [Amblyomma americanum]|uniref:Sodium-dependent multivitamin transporter n=1 Tax=Amblyomma americanum TaxID=6943 RepID=A0AAQ4DD21_AMBAM